MHQKAFSELSRIFFTELLLEYSAFKILVLLAGLMPNLENSTSLISMGVNTEAIAFMITYGVSAAVSVSNEPGAGNADRAKNGVAVTLKLSIFHALIVIISLLFEHNLCASSFSNSPVIKKEFTSMTPLFAISMLFDLAQGILSGLVDWFGLWSLQPGLCSPIHHTPHQLEKMQLSVRNNNNNKEKTILV